MSESRHDGERSEGRQSSWPLVDRITYEFDALNERLDRLEKLLTGNGTPERGVIVRLDRLEQSEARRTWWSRTACGASLTAVIGAVAAYVKS